MHNPFTHAKHCSFYLRVLLILPFLFMMSSCSHTSEKRIITTNDTIGYNCIAYWVDSYMKYIGEIPTKEEFLEYNDVGRAMESFGIKGEHLEKILSDTLYQELDYAEIFQCTSALSFEFAIATPQGILIASNYLLTHPTIQFINQDSCLLVVDSTLYSRDSSIVSFTVPMPEIMIKDSAFYYRGVKLSSIKECDNKAFYEVCQNTTPILIDYDSPVELIDTLCTYFGIYEVRTKLMGRGNKHICLYHSAPHVREADSVSNMPIYVLTDSLKQVIGYIDEYEDDAEEDEIHCKIVAKYDANGKELEISDEEQKQANDEFNSFVLEMNEMKEKNKVDDEDLLKKFVYAVQRAQSVIYRSNDTIYLNGKPVNDSCSVNEKSILIDLTHDNTYRDVCEIARFLIKKTSSIDFERSIYYFKSDDKIYKYLLNKHPEWKVKVTSDD